MPNRGQALVNRGRGVVGANDDGHPWPGRPLRVLKRRRSEDALDGVERELWATTSVDQPECPVVDRPATAPPFVGPTEHNRAARAFAERGTELARDERRLTLLTGPQAIRARLGDQERPRPRDVLETCQVRA